MVQWLVEEALLERIELEDTLERARENDEMRTAEAVEGSLRRREQAQLALQAGR